MVRQKSVYRHPDHLAQSIRVARGEIPADLVIRNVKFLDVFSGKFQQGDVAVFEGKIVGVADSYQARQQVNGESMFLVPGFIDAHVHIESSLMTPVRFQEAALPCGTTTVIWDPHEIANVKGLAGIEWALNSSEGLQLDFFVMVPSCVPSTNPELGLETSGAVLYPQDLSGFRSHPRVLGLAEMMNFPGLLAGEGEVMEKLHQFQTLSRDGHCPGLSGRDLNAYGVAGIHSCHESTRLEEAQEKLMKGIHVLIREGSCAKDADTLLPILNSYSSATIGLCSDDRNPADIEEAGHINAIIDKALRSGHKAEDIFRAASFGPAMMYGLKDRGAIAPGYQADLVLIKPTASGSWQNGFEIQSVFKSGDLVQPQDLAKLKAPELASIDSTRNLKIKPVQLEQLSIPDLGRSRAEVSVIGMIPGQILTNHHKVKLSSSSGQFASDLRQDVLKIGVFERHHGSGGFSLGFVQGFGLKKGAIATSINHDSHNIICVGANDQAMARAINRLIDIDGGIVVVGDSADQEESLALPVAGLMTDASPAEVTAALKRLKALTRELGCNLHEPFLQLSFLALPVIPSLKITDKGLVDVDQFKLVDLVSPEH